MPQAVDTEMKPNFTLSSAPGGDIQEGPALAKLMETHIPLTGHIARVKVGEMVAAGTLLAVHPDPRIGDMHAPVDGEVTVMSFEHVAIKPAESPEPAKPDESEDQVDGRPEPVDISGLEGDELLTALKSLGVDTCEILPAGTLIVNGVNKEPDQGVAEQLLRQRRDLLEKGLAVVRRLVNPSKTVLAVADSLEAEAAVLDGCSLARIKPVYPHGLDPLVVKAVTGREQPEGVTVIGVPELFALGLVAETGLPRTEAVVSVGGVVYRTWLGVPAGALLDHAGIKVNLGDRVVMGGPWGGRAAYSLGQGLDKEALGIAVIPRGAFPPVTDSPCLNCGECVFQCPARIMPNLISRCAEFKVFDKVREYGLDACFECGLCGFYCVGRRPLLQYIRLAREELAAIELAEAEAEGPSCPAPGTLFE
jgi:Na+-translocating ferredoxin:NAD+ oxidoreductase subunit C